MHPDGVLASWRGIWKKHPSKETAPHHNSWEGKLQMKAFSWKNTSQIVEAVYFRKGGKRGESNRERGVALTDKQEFFFINLHSKN